MRLYGVDAADYLELITRAPNQRDQISIGAAIYKSGKPVYSSVIQTTGSDISLWADWLENFWDEVPPLVLGNSDIALEYSHREHIGEGFFYVTRSGERLLQIYEQLGESNVTHAREIRALVGQTGE
jgi:hypothetical protein